jgi:hypothetical protein
MARVVKPTDRLIRSWQTFREHLALHPLALAAIDAVKVVSVEGTAVKMEVPAERSWLPAAFEEVRDLIEAALTLTLGSRMTVMIELRPPQPRRRAKSHPSSKANAGGSQGSKEERPRPDPTELIAASERRRALARVHRPRFQKVFDEVVADAKALSPKQVSWLDREWSTLDREEQQRAALDVLASHGIPTELRALADRVAHATPGMPPDARGAVTDAVIGRYVRLEARHNDAAILADLLDDALRSSNGTGPPAELPSKGDQTEPKCGHGARRGDCNYIACAFHPLGGMDLQDK